MSYLGNSSSYGYYSREFECNQFRGMFTKFYLNERFSDIIIIIIDDNRIPCHKLLLSQRSPVFKAMFLGNFKERKDNQILIKETSIQIFKPMLEFIYKERLEIKVRNNYLLAIQVLKLSHRFQVKNLVLIIERELKTMIKIENFIELLNLSKMYDLIELMNALKNFTKGKVRAIKELGNFGSNVGQYFDINIKSLNKTDFNDSKTEIWNFDEYYLNNELSDIILIINGNRIISHKMLLSANSSVFDSMLSEEFEKSKQKEIEIKDTAFDESFKFMIEFMYKPKTVMKKTFNYLFAIEVLKTSIKFQTKNLIDSMERVLGKMITNENFVEILEFYKLYELKNLLKDLKYFAGNESNKVIDFISFVNIPNDTINYYLSIFEKQSLVTKALKKIKAENPEKDLKQFKKYISLELCSAEDIESLRDLNLLTERQSFNVLKQKLIKAEHSLRESKLNECYCERKYMYEEEEESDEEQEYIRYGFESEEEIDISSAKKLKQN